VKQQNGGPTTPSVEPPFPQAKAEAKLNRLVDLMRVLIEEGFTGSIKVNFSQGGIGRIEKFEEILK
jgi:hypothetical protein